jgi:hypothetical protein
LSVFNQIFFKNSKALKQPIMPQIASKNPQNTRKTPQNRLFRPIITSISAFELALSQFTIYKKTKKIKKKKKKKKKKKLQNSPKTANNAANRL